MPRDLVPFINGFVIPKERQRAYHPRVFLKRALTYFTESSTVLSVDCLFILRVRPASPATPGKLVLTSRCTQRTLYETKSESTKSPPKESGSSYWALAHGTASDNVDTLALVPLTNWTLLAVPSLDNVPYALDIHEIAEAVAQLIAD